MSKEKIVANKDLPAVVPTTSNTVIEELTTRGYDAPAINSYAKAARSWTEKGSLAWDVWLKVEVVTSGSM